MLQGDKFNLTFLLLLLFITPNALAENSAEQIMEEKCALCHEVPKVEKLSREQWVIKVDEMAPSAGLSSSEKSIVKDYVNSYVKGAASVLSMKNEKKLFDDKCGLCHTTERALIMPMTAESVVEIVTRMQAMSEGWISDGEAHEILEYLNHGAPDSKRPTRNQMQIEDPYQLFLQRCTACHNAERVFSLLESDKKKGTPVADWPEIVNRMQQKAPNWLTKQESVMIIDFLQSR